MAVGGVWGGGGGAHSERKLEGGQGQRMRKSSEDATEKRKTPTALTNQLNISRQGKCDMGKASSAFGRGELSRGGDKGDWLKTCAHTDKRPEEIWGPQEKAR